MKAYMSLTCDTGAYEKVLRELMLLNIPLEDMFLIFGPMDMLVQFTHLNSLEEFKEKWFDRVRMIGAGESLITRTLTFIVVSEGPSYSEQPFAFLFLNTQPRNLERVQKAVLGVAGVLSADIVLGPNDIICPVRASDTRDLEQTLSRIRHGVADIEAMMTYIAAPRQQVLERIQSLF
jgi:Lrp/AsnC ligand binding domain